MSISKLRKVVHKIRLKKMGSLAILIIWAWYLWVYEPKELLTLSVIKKKTGEAVRSIYVAPLIKPIYFETKRSGPLIKPGYLSVADPPDSYGRYRIRQANEKCTVLLIEMPKDISDLIVLLRGAVSAGYNSVILTGDVDMVIPDWVKEKIPVFVFTISTTDSYYLRDYAFPTSVRFFLTMENTNFLQPIYPNSVRPFFIVRDERLFYLLLQPFLIGVVLLAIFELLFLKNQDRLVIGALKKAIYHLLHRNNATYYTYDVLKPPLSSHDGIFFLITWLIKQKFKLILIRKYTYVDVSIIDKEHIPWGVPVGKKDFNVGRALGYGSFGTVEQVTFVRTIPKKLYAMKSMLTVHPISILEAEILACGNCCEGILKLAYGFVSPLHVHFVTELMIGCLKEFMQNIQISHAKVYTVELALAIETLHSLGVCHRDLKPANILVDHNHHLKIGDFGCAKKIAEDEIIEEEHHTGTTMYWAPENYQKKWSRASDWWAFACIIYEMFSRGHQPLLNSTKLQSQLKNNHPVHDELKNRISESGTSKQYRDLLVNCLVTNPTIRYPLFGKDEQKLRFKSLTKFAEISIPINREVNLKDEYELKRAVINGVPEIETSYQLALKIQHEKMNHIYQSLFRDRVIPSQHFYFDHKDLQCYKNNSLLTEYFK